MTTPDALRDAEYIADVSNIPYEDPDNDEAPIVGRADLDSRQRKEFHAKTKTVLLDRLLRNFDTLIYGQLSALYYMDCSIMHLAIRAMVQLLFLTPKVGPFPEPTKNQPYVGSILLSNLLCIFLHCISSTPDTDEASRGYLHGGLFIDFVGQQAPSKFRIVAFDILVLVLQIVMLGVVLEKEDIKLSSSSESSGDSVSLPQDAGNTQDHDSEERGVLRSDSHQLTPTASGNDIELQDMGRSHSTAVDGEHEGLLAGSADSVEMPNERYRHPRDQFMSGQMVIAEMNVFEMVRSQWRRTPGSNTTRSPQSNSPEAGEAARILRSRFGVNLVVRR